MHRLLGIRTTQTIPGIRGYSPRTWLDLEMLDEQFSSTSPPAYAAGVCKLACQLCLWQALEPQLDLSTACGHLSRRTLRS